MMDLSFHLMQQELLILPQAQLPLRLEQNKKFCS